MNNQWAKSKSLPYACLVGVILAGAWFRLFDLDKSSLRADTINFYNVCRMEITAGDILTKWKEMGLDHPPLTLWGTKFVIDLFGLPVTHVTLRLLPALFGILAVPVMFLVGRRIGGAALGLLLAALFAVNPFSIQVSREAYHYSLLILASSLLFLGTVEALLAVRDRSPLGRGFYASAGAGFFLITQSTFTGWGVAFVECLVILGALAWRWKKQGAPVKVLWGPILMFVVLGIPTLVAPWGLTHVLGKIGGAGKQMGLKALAVSEQNLGTMLRDVPTQFAWGSTPLRLAFTAVVIASLVYVLVADRKRRGVGLVSVGILAASFVIFVLSRSAIGAVYESRFVAGLLPVYLSLLGIGIWGWFAAGSRAGSWVSAALALAAIGLNIYPAHAATQITGKPTPYREIVDWCDSNLPNGTLVLVDRWFEPWNELKVYPSTNVFFAFTIPNEPVDVYVGNRWRDTAVEFFQRHPGAAYLEIAKSYFNVPGVGAWPWPRENFARQEIFANSAGLALRRLGLAARGEFYAANTNRLVVELFYNTRDDVVAKARAAGRASLVVFGRGWGYTKTQDFRDWRVLQQQAVLDVYNLEPAPVDAQLRVRGLAMNGSKLVRQGAQSFTFEANRLKEWTIRAVLQPGLNEVEFSDGMGRGDPPLLVADAVCEPAAAGPAPAQ